MFCKNIHLVFYIADYAVYQILYYDLFDLVTAYNKIKL